MKKLFIVFTFILSVSLLTACTTKNQIIKDYKAELIKTFNKEKISEYVEGDVMITAKDSGMDSKYTHLWFTIKAKLNDEFANLTDEEKYEVLSDINNRVYDHYNNSGKKIICYVDIFDFSDDYDKYSFSPYGRKITFNGEKFEEPSSNEPGLTITTDDNKSSNSPYTKEELESDPNAPSTNPNDYNSNGEYVPHNGVSNNPADYNSNGEYKPIESMTKEEMEKELIEMLEGSLNGR